MLIVSTHFLCHVPYVNPLVSTGVRVEDDPGIKST
jgi:hypothetical protein